MSTKVIETNILLHVHTEPNDVESRPHTSYFETEHYILVADKVRKFLEQTVGRTHELFLVPSGFLATKCLPCAKLCIITEVEAIQSRQRPMKYSLSAHADDETHDDTDQALIQVPRFASMLLAAYLREEMWL